MTLQITWLWIWLLVGYIDTPMVQTESIASFDVIGIQMSTTNKREVSNHGKIPQQWQKFFNQDVMHSIPDRTSDDIYAVFSDYESNRNGSYKYLIGMKVKKRAHPPAGMVTVRIVGGTYAKFASQSGQFSQVVPALWSQVWILEDQALLLRSYNTDFEVYPLQKALKQSGQVNLYVGTQ